MLAVKLVSPVYCAVNECVPSPNRLACRVAGRPLFKQAVPRLLLPSKNVTIPVGAPIPGGTTAIPHPRVLNHDEDIFHWLFCHGKQLRLGFRVDRQFTSDFLHQLDRRRRKNVRLRRSLILCRSDSTLPTAPTLRSALSSTSVFHSLVDLGVRSRRRRE
jgi:hypothetical protein